MGKKKNRSHINASNNYVQNSFDSVSIDISSDVKCSHVPKSINPSIVRKTLKRDGIKDQCSTCYNLHIKSSDINKENNNNKLSLLVCLKCGNQSCGKEVRNHAEEHYRKPHSDLHCLAVNLLDWRIFCHECKIFIDVNSYSRLGEIVCFLKELIPSKVYSRNNDMPKPKEYNPNYSDNTKEDSFQSFPVKGLSNLGNTCFFNSVLQCLAQTPYLIEVLEDLINPRNKFFLPGGELKIAINDDDIKTHTLPPIEKTLDSSGNFAAVFYRTLVEMRNPNSSEVYKPSSLLSTLRKKISHCTDGGQHDSHELLRLLLELIRNEDLQRYQSIILREMSLDNNEIKQSKDIESKAFLTFYENQANSKLLGVESLFRGILESTVKCIECKNSSRRTEYFMDLSLPVIIEKSQQFNAKQKNEKLDITCNKYYSGDRKSKHQLKKEKRAAKKSRRSNKKFHNHKIHSDEDETDTSNLKIENVDAENHILESKTEELIDVENHVNATKKNIFGKQMYANSNNCLELERTDISNEPDAEAVNQDDNLHVENEDISHESTPCINDSIDSNDLITKLSNMSISRDTVTSQAFIHQQIQNNNISIESCLHQFTAIELLDDNNKVQCKVCTDRINKTRCENISSSKMVCTASYKQYLISQSPPVLILHLKRFQSQKFNGYHKADKHVSFPLQLNLAPFCKNKTKQKLYSLYGLIEHTGTINGGHYVAYIKARKKLDPSDSRWSFLLKKDASGTENEENHNDTNDINMNEEKNSYDIPGRWFYTSDSRVSQIDEATVLKKQAYLLFYERIL